MSSLSSKRVLVYDFGLFTEVAVRLARDFHQVWYFCPWQEDFPRYPKAAIGQGLEGVERIQDFFRYVDRADLIVFPDTHSGDLVEFLKAHSYPVVGAGRAERLELDRWYARETQRQVGLPTQKTIRVSGLESLRDTLQRQTDVYVKLNIFRGEIETFKSPTILQSKPLLDWISVEFGPRSETMEFVVEDEVAGVEPGLDAIFAGTHHLSPTLYGYELKGGIYLGRVLSYEDLPYSLKSVSDALEPILENFLYRMFYSTEVRVTRDGTPFLIDLTMRLASPTPGLLQTELIKNYPEVMWGLLSGETPPEPIMPFKYAGGALLNSSWAEDHWLPLELTEEQRRWVKLRRAMRHGKQHFVVPGMEGVGVVIAMGNSIYDVIAQLKERRDEVSAHGLIKEPIDEEKVMEELQEGRSRGVNI